MELTNSFTVPADVDTAWKTLLDVESIAPCMPGATLDHVDGEEFTGRVKVKLGPVTMTYGGKAKFVEVDEANHTAVIEAAGSETRGTGTAKATVHTSMHAEGPETTRVDVVTDLAITGKPAQFGRGVMQDVAGKIIGQFSDNLAATLAAGGAAAAAGAAAAPAGQPAAATAEGGATPGGVTVDVSDTARAALRPVAVQGDDAIDLLSAGTPIFKRLIPVAIGAVVVAVIVWIATR